MSLDLFPHPLYIINLYTVGNLSHSWTSCARPEDLGGAVRFIDAQDGARMYVPGDVRVTYIPALFNGSHSRAGRSPRY